jgi:hypothetical protein
MSQRSEGRRAAVVDLPNRFEANTTEASSADDIADIGLTSANRRASGHNPPISACSALTKRLTPARPGTPPGRCPPVGGRSSCASTRSWRGGPPVQGRQRGHPGPHRPRWTRGDRGQRCGRAGRPRPGPCPARTRAHSRADWTGVRRPHARLDSGLPAGARPCHRTRSDPRSRVPVRGRRGRLVGRRDPIQRPDPTGWS